MKSAIECHIHAVFAGLVKPDDVCGLGWQQGMFLVLGLKNRCLVKKTGASCLVEGTGAWSKKQVLRAWLREQVLGWTAPCCPLSLDFLRRESELLDGRMDAKNWGRGLG